MKLPPEPVSAYAMKRAKVWDSIFVDLEDTEDPAAWLERIRTRKAPVALVYWDELPEAWRAVIEARVEQRMENMNVRP